MEVIRGEQPITAQRGSHRSDRPVLAFDYRVRLSITRALLADALIVAVTALLLLRAFMH
ncbi:MAG: hypothetical protein WCF33_20815 [Pseudonocardiaceae bacterium]